MKNQRQLQALALPETAQVYAPAARPAVNSAPINDPARRMSALIEHVSSVFIGKEPVVTRACLALCAGGHVLLEDVPGLGKTLLAKALARSLDAEFRRVQFTADLLPSDITGVTVFLPDRGGFEFRKGPVFTEILLADEINRATPRTQSSLLEAMEEEHVTVDGTRHSLPPLFFVIATQNPVELEGTYPLPFAQMDRFMVRLSIGYLDRAREIEMLQKQRSSDPLEELGPVLDCAALLEIRRQVRAVAFEESLAGYLVDVVRATRSSDLIEFGASPRATLDLQRFSQALALLRGRDYVLPDDIKEAARCVLPHRLIGRRGSRAVSVADGAVLDPILDSIAVPV